MWYSDPEFGAVMSLLTSDRSVTIFHYDVKFFSWVLNCKQIFKNVVWWLNLKMHGVSISFMDCTVFVLFSAFLGLPIMLPLLLLLAFTYYIFVLPFIFDLSEYFCFIYLYKTYIYIIYICRLPYICIYMETDILGVFFKKNLTLNYLTLNWEI